MKYSALFLTTALTLATLSPAQEKPMEKIIETFVIDGVEFTLIEKPATLYAGTCAIAPDLNSEPDLNSLMKDEEVFKLIKDSVTPDRKFVLRIDQATNERPGAVLVGQETTSREQPEGIHVIEAEPTMLVKVKNQYRAFVLIKKLTGKEPEKMGGQIQQDLFGLVKHVFCEGEGASFEFNGCRQNGNEEMEIYHINGWKMGVAVPVRRRDGNAGAVKLNAKNDFKLASFEYRDIGKTRFIGIDMNRADEKLDDVWTRIGPTLDALMPKHASGITENCTLGHHNGTPHAENYLLVGRFFKVDTPVPEGFAYYDVPTTRAGYAIYHDDNFRGDYFQPAYEITRDKILDDGVKIPYPEGYWTAEVYTNGRVKEGAHRFGYLFSVEDKAPE